GDHHDVPVAGRDAVARLVVFDAAAAEEPPQRGQMQRDVAPEFNGADEEVARGDEYDTALVAVAGVNRRLDCGGVERGAVALRAKIAHVVRAGAEGLVVSRGAGRAGQSPAERCRDGRRGHLPEPLASG